MVLPRPQPKQPWWKTEWFWGGAVPLLPTGALAVLALAGIDPRSAGWVLVLAFIPMALMGVAAMLILGGGFLRDLRTDEEGRRVLLMALAVCGAFLLLVVGVSADDCVWQSDAGGQIEPVHLNDYTFAFQPAREAGTLCLTLRSPEGTSLACDNGTEFALVYGRDPAYPDMHTIVLGDEVYRPLCADK